MKNDISFFDKINKTDMKTNTKTKSRKNTSILNKISHDHDWARTVAIEWKNSIDLISHVYYYELNKLQSDNVDLYNEFCKQIEQSREMGLRSQKKLVLMLLQLSLIYKIIKVDKIDYKISKSFCGWYSFKIINKKFIDMIYTYFPTCINRYSINNVFRRCGFIPVPQWRVLWDKYDDHELNLGVTLTYHGMKR